MKIEIWDEFLTCAECGEVRRHEVQRTETVVDKNYDKIEFEYTCKTCGNRISEDHYGIGEIPF